MSGARAVPTDGGRVLVVGAINVDFVVAADRLPAPGETVVGPRLERHGGGKGANAAVAAARAGARVVLVGAVGVDDTGEGALAELAAEGVDVSGVVRLRDEASGAALIVVDRHGENQIAVGAGANAALSTGHVREAMRAALAGCGCVLVSTEVAPDAVVDAVILATDAGVPCILNPAPAIPEVLPVLDRGIVLTPNGGEIEELLDRLSHDGGGEGEAGDTDQPTRASRLAERTGATVVATLGRDGAVIAAAGEEPLRVGAPPVQARDTTGAGDTFNGVLAARLAQHDSLDEAVRTAVIAASLSVGEVGARGGMPSLPTIEAALAAV